MLWRSLGRLCPVAVVLVALVATPLPVRASLQVIDTSRVSDAFDGTPASGPSVYPAMSGDGAVVAFESSADNLVVGDGNGVVDVFVHDTDTGMTVRASVASDGTEANERCHGAALSEDGTIVAFQSSATNLVPGDTNGESDVFVHDITTGVTVRVSVASDGTEADRSSSDHSLSSDGSVVAFVSRSDSLVPGDTNSADDVFVHDTKTGTTSRVSVASDGTEANKSSYDTALSADGTVVAFRSSADNLVSGDTNGADDVFVHDVATGTTRRVSVSSDGTEGNLKTENPVLSGDGTVVAYHSLANNLVPGDTIGYDVFVHDTKTGITTRVSVASDGTEADNDSYFPSISGNGEIVAFTSRATNLVPGDTNTTRDVFVHATTTRATSRVSVATDGTEANAGSNDPAISADGTAVAYWSMATNLVPGGSIYYGEVYATRITSPAGPLLEPIEDVVVETDTVQEVRISASDPDGDQLAFALSGAPPFASLVDHADGSATLTVAPSVGDIGVYPGVTITVTDGAESDSQAITITVANRSILLAEHEDKIEPYGWVISPDGQRLVYSVWNDAFTGGDLYSVELTATSPPVKLNGELLGLIGMGPDIQRPMLTPDSQSVLYFAGSNGEPRQLMRVGVAGGDPVPISPEVDLYVLEAQLSSDGQYVVVTADRDLWSVATSGGDLTRLNQQPVDGGGVGWFSISPDSSTVVYAGDLDVPAVQQLYTVPIDGGQPISLSDPALHEHPYGNGFSPDSAWVVFKDTHHALYAVPSIGGPVTQLAPADHYVGWYDFLPDSENLVYWSFGGSPHAIYRVSLDGELTPLDEALEGTDVPSPPLVTSDGTWVIYERYEDDGVSWEMLVVAAEGGASRHIMSGTNPSGGRHWLRAAPVPDFFLVEMDSEILIGDEYHFKEDWLIVYPATATYSVLIDGEPWATRSLKTFADDGSWVVFEEAGQLFAIPTEGGDAIPVTQSGTGSYIPTQTVPGADAIVYLVSNDYSPEPGRFYVASVPLVAAPIDVSIDIEPSREDNRIRADGRVSVLLRGSEELSVGSVATDTLRFGPGRAIPRYLTIGDLDRDGFDDVLAQFKVSDTGLVPGDTSACLSGQLDSGQEFVGCDAVHVVPSGRRR